MHSLPTPFVGPHPLLPVPWPAAGQPHLGAPPVGFPQIHVSGASGHPPRWVPPWWAPPPVRGSLRLCVPAGGLAGAHLLRAAATSWKGTWGPRASATIPQQRGSQRTFSGTRGSHRWSQPGRGGSSSGIMGSRVRRLATWRRQSRRCHCIVAAVQRVPVRSATRAAGSCLGSPLTPVLAGSHAAGALNSACWRCRLSCRYNVINRGSCICSVLYARLDATLRLMCLTWRTCQVCALSSAWHASSARFFPLQGLQSICPSRVCRASALPNPPLLLPLGLPARDS